MQPNPPSGFNEGQPAYLDPAQPISKRVQDLLARLTLQEKISQMTNEAAPISRLNIPAYNFWSEALHGVARNGRATVFPAPIGMAATWDRELIYQAASAISDEARAKYHETLRRQGFTGQYQGLTLWSPNVNIFRDPRWGRGQETWGEDPYLTGELGAAFVRGMQGEDPRYLKTGACAKHYAVHSGPEKLRHVFNAQVSLRELHDTYLPAFRKLVRQAKVEAVMGAYNRVNGQPCCASPYLLEETLRQDWGFEGHVVSDCWALTNIHKDHKVTQDVVGSAALALQAGCDLSCMCTYDHLGEAIERGLVTEADIDKSLARTLTTRFKLGMFDPPETVPYTSIPYEVVGSQAHRQLAYQSALESIVLLKNEPGCLPVGKNVRTLYVVGPNAANLDVLLGNYYGLSSQMTTLLEGIVAQAPEDVRVEYRQGCMLTQPATNRQNWSLPEASAADLTIAVMGSSPLLEGEEGEAILTTELGDRAQIELPTVQVEYLNRLVDLGGKVVLVLTGGSPIALGQLAERMMAILWVGYPGQEGGSALGNVLFGRAAPSGKLPVTFPRSTQDLPPFEDYSMQGRTYRYLEIEPLYPFGFGLSYTRFSYRDLVLSKAEIVAGEPLEIQVTVRNIGKTAGKEVVQVYLSDVEASVVVPYQRLVAFQQVALQPGEERVVTFWLEPEAMCLVDEQGESHLEPGVFRLTIGGCSPGERGITLGAPVPVIGEFQVR